MDKEVIGMRTPDPEQIRLGTRLRSLSAFVKVITVPDTYAESHISCTVVKAGATAHRAAQNKTDKYASLASTHIFCPFAIETAGAWHMTQP